MIPHKLIIKNFLSYGETPAVINFDPYNLICLSGKNGNGKSALLDAMTWAIWGHARKISGISKPDEGLLRLGTSRMLVTIELSFNNQYYRIRREYARAASKAILSLDFEIRQESHGFFSSLTDKTIRATQEKINRLLGIDYETFVNSSFIRQGHSNEFSKKSPKERKEILGSILGLDHYQTLQSAALDKVRAIQLEHQMLDRIDTIARQEIEQQNNPILAIDLEQNETKLRAELVILKTKDQELTKELHWLETNLIQQKQLHERIIIEELEIKNLQEKTRENYLLFKRLHSKILKENQNKTKENLKTELEEKSKLFLIAQQKQSLLQKEIELNQRALDTMQIEHEAAKKALQLKIDPLQKTETRLITELTHIKMQDDRINKELIGLQKKELETSNVIEKLSKETSDYATLEALFEKRKTFYQFLQQKNQLIDRSISELQPKKEQLEIGSSAHCPLCDQLVTAARKKFLQNKITKDQTRFLYQKNKIINLLKKLKDILIAQHTLLQEKRDQKKQLEHEQRKKTEFFSLIEKEKKELSELNLQYKQKEEELDTTKKELLVHVVEMNKEPTILYSKQKEIELIKQKIKALDYQSEAHSQLNKKLHDLYQSNSPEAIEKQKTEKALKKADVSHLCALLKKAYSNNLLLKKQLLPEPTLEPIVANKQLEKKQLASTLEHVQKELEKTVADRARLANEKLRIQKLETAMIARTKQKESLQKESLEYQLIAQAFSKNGIPALLIEEVIPELEAEANFLLQKLTNNQAQIFIESVRDLKKGGVKETLDIHISDSSGIRPYEMFSGGEAFRIDFALRIAISKLLARRAGTPLQTLIIDEGFGSQDEEGLQKIMDAIYKIQHDFAKIIIVSHLPLMKDNFPVHFVIEKGALGSQVSVEEKG